MERRFSLTRNQKIFTFITVAIRTKVKKCEQTLIFIVCALRIHDIEGQRSAHTINHHKAIICIGLSVLQCAISNN